MSHAFTCAGHMFAYIPIYQFYS